VTSRVFGRARVLRLGAVGVAIVATVALSQLTASGSFTGVTGSATNRASSAATFCTEEPDTLHSTGDSWTDESAPTTNHLSDLDLRVRSGSSTSTAPGTRRHIWIGFDLPPNPDPAHCQIIRAELSLYNKLSVSGRYIDVYRATATWTAATVLWSNEPTYEGPVATATAPTGGEGWQQWTVPPQVLAQYTVGSYGFLLRDRAENTEPTAYEQVYYDQQNAIYAPQLVLTWG
jgi:hypothetical protein